MKRIIYPVLFLMCLMGMMPSQDRINLTGVWSGKTRAMPFQMDLAMTLSLLQTEEGLTGTMSDTMNFLSRDIFDVEVKEGILLFKIVTNTEGTPTIQFRLAISQNELTGEWKSTDGVSGEWTAAKETETSGQADPQPEQSLDERYIRAIMDKYKIPGTGIVGIEKGKIEWVESFGTVNRISMEPVTERTSFQAASVSKSITAAIVFHYVDEGTFDLDTDVNRYLKSWKVPDNQFTKNRKVTLRDLLSHRGGMPAGGFPQKQSAGDPTLVQILKGELPAMNPPPIPESIPGSRWQYSNIGYAVIQKILEDRLEKPFARIARETVFEPLKMTRSTFLYPISSGPGSNEAMPHNTKGIPEEPAMNPAALAHGGMMTCARDLAVFVIEIIRAYHGESALVISQKSARLMIDKGVGVFNQGEGRSLSFYHPGQNLPGTTAWIIGFPDTRQGAVILSNGAEGIEMSREILSLIGKQYHWPET